MAGVSTGVVTASSPVVGVTFTVMVPETSWPSSSMSVYSKEPVPEKPSAGVKTALPPVMVTVPLVGLLTVSRTRPVPVPSSVRSLPSTVTAVFTGVLTALSPVVGVTVTVIVPVASCPSASTRV